MNTLPLLGRADPDAADYNTAIAYTEGELYTRAQFLAQVIALANELPERPAVLNLVRDRYHFLVTFAAALLRGQSTLLPPTRAPTALAVLAQQYPASYCLTDGPDTVEGLAAFHYLPADRPSQDLRIPEIPREQTAAVVFTSGTSGVPKANQKTWGALSTVARDTAMRFALADPPTVTVVATVPHHHMFGLETSIMLPLQCGLGCYAGKPLFPEDIRTRPPTGTGAPRAGHHALAPARLPHGAAHLAGAGLHPVCDGAARPRMGPGGRGDVRHPRPRDLRLCRGR